MGDNNKPQSAFIATSEESAGHEEESVEIKSSDGDITITIHRHFCKGCEICVEVCPKDVLKMIVAPDRWEGTLVDVVNMEACNACMLCEHQCPDFAIEVLSIKKERKKKEKKAVG